MEGIRQQRVQMQQQEQAQAQMQQLEQAWCTFNSNSRNQQLKMRGFAHTHCDRFAPCPHGWRFGVPRPFRFEFPKVTQARAGNLQIHRRPCFLHARSDLERVITLRSKGYRDLLVFDGCFCFLPEHSTVEPVCLALGQDSRWDEARVGRWICRCDLNVPSCPFVFRPCHHRAVRLYFINCRDLF